MRIEKVTDEAALAVRAADIIAAGLETDAPIFGFPTGTTPIDTYFELARRADAGEIDMTGALVFAVDEFLGATRKSAGTNSMFFRQYLRAPVKALHCPNPAAEHPGDHITAYADAIRRQGGLQLCMLGVGTNGHVAFNEPGSAQDCRARVVDLSEETRNAHVATFGSLDAVPRQGLTLGIADLMEAKSLLVLVQGASKAAILKAAIEDKPSADVPASWLRDHPDITWLIDEAAAAQLRE
jgi:glucosamine-6-phosphate deaminase